MAVKIRLKRMGKIRAPFYRVVVMDARTKRDGRAIEEIGKYHPTEQPSVIQIDSDRAQYWLTQGAQPTEAVAALLKVTGDWQRFSGEDGAEGTLQVKEPRTSKKDLYEAAVAAVGRSADGGKDTATTPRRKAEKQAPAVPAPDVTAASAEPVAVETPAADSPAAVETPAAEPTPQEVAPAADTDSGEAAVHGTDSDADAAADSPAAESASAEPVAVETPAADSPAAVETPAAEPTPEEVAPAADTDSGEAAAHGTNSDADADAAAEANPEPSETGPAGA